LDNLRVVVASGAWVLSGINTFAANLVRGLRGRNVSAELLITGRNPGSGPPDIELRRLPVRPNAPLRRRWTALKAYLEERAPCVYIPNCDVQHSCVIANLSGRVAVVGIVHSDDPGWYAEIGRLGTYLDAVVAVSRTVEGTVARLNPELRPRLVHIPYGTWIPERCPAKVERADPALRIVSASRLVQVQKRVLDLPGIATALAKRGVLFHLTVVGDGEDRNRLLAGLAPFLADGRAEYKGLIPNEAIPAELERHDVFLMTSAYEGLPIGLLEAMGRGCVPVVTDIASGIPELVQEGVNGFRVSVGDTATFAQRLEMLQSQPALRGALSLRAHETVYRGGYRVEDMTDRYLQVFRRALMDAASGAFRRPRGRIVLPAELQWMQPTWKDWLPEPVRAVANRCKRALCRIRSALIGRKSTAFPFTRDHGPQPEQR
jgi:glycosyltransferase involved in cell wall biosynthesis